jgi:hypothetical protein
MILTRAFGDPMIRALAGISMDSTFSEYNRCSMLSICACGSPLETVFIFRI